MVWNERRGIGHSPSADSIRRESEASLRRLKVDAIDQIYWPDPDRDIEEGWGNMAALKKEHSQRRGGEFQRRPDSASAWKAPRSKHFSPRSRPERHVISGLCREPLSAPATILDREKHMFKLADLRLAVVATADFGQSEMYVSRNRLSGRGRAARFASLTCQVVGALLATASPLAAQEQQNPVSAACAGDNGGITLPPGFCATVFADNIGHARHLVVAPNGVVYVNTWSGTYYGNDTPPPGGFLVALQDNDGDGQADATIRFGPTFAEGGHGGTGITLDDGALYAEANDRIVRYALLKDGIAPTGSPETIVSGLPLTGDHPMHPFAIDAQGGLYVNSGSATNACQVENRVAGSPGHQPCSELATRAGIWRYDANRTGQQFSPAERFATGIRNAVGIAVDASGLGLYATQHGRDQLHENWPSLYSQEQGANLPAEELLRVEQGADYGWPECYFEHTQNKLVLAPEYGGDGGKKVGICADKKPPIAVFPAHWAPNALLLYDGDQFPAAYQGGAFIAFHGSWNRAPSPQGGYNVVFQPLADGKPTGKYLIFADGFAGAVKDPGEAAHRPSGLAVGPDGALYIADDQRGRIWRVSFHGDPKTTGLAAAASPTTATAAIGSTARQVEPPEGIHPDAGAEEMAALPTPPGATAAQVALGERVYHGQAGGATCAGCHGSNAKGTPLGPDLTSGRWLWGDGSLAAITRTITDGVANPKEYRSVMPPMGGAQLSPSEVTAVSAYVWALSH
jgi:glucose/arabinose dehydrogenase/mono/diheme cytochrome c family protein